MSRIRPESQYTNQPGNPPHLNAEYTEKSSHVGWLLLPDGWKKVESPKKPFGYARDTTE